MKYLKSYEKNYIKKLKYKEGDFVRFVSIEGLFIIVIIDVDAETDFNYRIENVKTKDRYWAKEEQIFPVKKSDVDVAIYKYNI